MTASKPAAARLPGVAKADDRRPEKWTRRREGDPDRNTDSAEKRLCMNNFVADFGRPLDSNRIFSQQVAEESRLLFNCYINELENVGAKPCPKVPVTDSNIHFQEVMHTRARLEEELHCHTKFNIPNFVNTDQSSLGEDDLLISEPPIILENKPVIHASHYIPD
ncbi:melanocortin-2 receptor accessory protein 2 isoform X4 [Anolis carolinensis]|uniref:melanocortin-2 receptor accessory protein 2 isoform X4 n=1 Tax=Anolis carolinensis TaxID=28377 RepID=UPI002F2B4BE2